MKILVTVIMLFTVTGCTTIQSKTGGSAFIEGASANKAYNSSMKAASLSGMTIINTDRESGLITATKGANRFLTYSNPTINIIVSDFKDGASVVVSSVVGGQMFDYGVTANTVRDFCASLNQISPGANCH